MDKAAPPKAIYDMHTYWSKKHWAAIREYIRHYLPEKYYPKGTGLVLDCFSRLRHDRRGSDDGGPALRADRCFARRRVYLPLLHAPGGSGRTPSSLRPDDDRGVSRRTEEEAASRSRARDREPSARNSTGCTRRIATGAAARPPPSTSCTPSVSSVLRAARSSLSSIARDESTLPGRRSKEAEDRAEEAAGLPALPQTGKRRAAPRLRDLDPHQEFGPFQCWCAIVPGRLSTRRGRTAARRAAKHQESQVLPRARLCQSWSDREATDSALVSRSAR